MVEFQHLRHQFKKNPPVDVETNVLGRTALPWRFRNPKIVGGCFQLRFSSQDVDVRDELNSMSGLAAALCV